MGFEGTKQSLENIGEVRGYGMPFLFNLIKLIIFFFIQLNPYSHSKAIKNYSAKKKKSNKK